jgi:Ca2+-binding EF-hand superfamily protein
MDTKTLLRLLLTVALIAVVVPDADAQRGGKGGRGKGKKGPGVSLLLPRSTPAGPTIDPLSALTKPLGPGARPGRSGSLLPAPDSQALDSELPELPAFDIDGAPFPWTDPRDPDLEAHYFSVCDHDGNEWVSFREARVSLATTRPAFALYDTDQDGRIRREEFSARYATVVERSGSFPPPKAKVGGSAPSASAGNPALPEADPALVEAASLLGPYDQNKDKKLMQAELAPIIALYGLTGRPITPERLIGAADDDGSGAIDEHEFPVLLETMRIAQKKFLGTSESPFAPSATSKEVFTTPTIQVDRGPRTRFERLDQDGDGFVSVEDLALLQSPMHLSVRTSAVVASLDRDGDGKLSRDEFARALE